MKQKRSGALAPPSSDNATRPSGLMRRLMASLRRRQQAVDLPPAGQRSGEGSDSLAPFLEQARSSRPAPLE